MSERGKERPPQDGDSDYLWDGSGEPDPEVLRLERLLSPLAYDPKRRVVVPMRRRWWPPVAGVIAVAAVAAVVALLVWRRPGGPGIAAVTPDAGVAGPPPAWKVTQVDGNPLCNGQEMGLDGALLALGQTLTTDGESRAILKVADIGKVTVEPNSQVKLLTTGAEEHRLSLERGAIQAEIDAPPRLFWVNTPSATAIDYGCAYRLRVKEDGTSVLHVDAGWVALEGVIPGGALSVIPAGGIATSRPGRGPGTPRFFDTSDEFRIALDRFDAGDHSAENLAALRKTARVRDTLSLWHVVQRVAPYERPAIVARMVELVPGYPRGVDEGALVNLDPDALGTWRDKLQRSWGGSIPLMEKPPIKKTPPLR